MNDRHYDLCKKAAFNWPTGADLFVLNENEEAFSRAHAPRLVMALWEAYWQLTKTCKTFDGRLICAVCGHERCVAECPVRRIEALSREGAAS